jgi:hypothetical protein
MSQEYEVSITDELDFEKELTKNSRVLVLNPINTYWSYQMTGEAALRASRKAETTRWVNVASQVNRNFEINIMDNLPSWRYKNPSKRMGKILSQESILVDSRFTSKKQKYSVPDFASLNELRNFQFSGLNFGAIVFSAITSVKHSTSFNLQEIRYLTEHFFSLGFETHARIEAEIRQFKPTHILTTNDRLMGSALAMALASKYSVSGKVLYWGSDGNKIQDYNDTLYDSSQWQDQVASNWNEGPPNQRELEVLLSEIDDLARDPNLDSLSYTHTHIRGKSIPRNRKTCIFYAQSEHEHSGHFIPKVSGRFANQYEAFEILQKVAILAGYDLYLKYHPLKNLKKFKSSVGTNNLDWKSVELLDEVKEIQPDSDLDTYQLIMDADVNVVWSSIVGLESIARNCPTIVVGNPQWLNPSWGIQAWTHDDLCRIFSLPIRSIGRDSLAPWFWHAKNFGSNVKYFKLRGHFVSYGSYLIIKERFFIRFFFEVIRSLNHRINLLSFWKTSKN